jgi:RNA polymerase sigma-70 factor (ECF subfamily)
MHDKDLGAPGRRHAAAPRRRHPDVTPHILALLERAQRGDRDAFADLYTAFREPVTRYICVRMRDRDRDAIPDLVQETFTSALANLSTALLDVRGWFIIRAAIACNQYDWSRRRYVRAAYAIRDSNRPDTVPAFDGDQPARPGRITFVHAIARLTADQRRAIQLRYLDGYPRDTAARLMGRSAEAVRCLERRAIHRMQAALTPPPVLSTKSSALSRCRPTTLPAAVRTNA